MRQGYKLPEEEKKIKYATRRGKIAWNKGLTKETDERVKKGAEAKKNKPCSEEHKIKISKSMKGKNTGKKHLKETIEKICKANKGKRKSKKSVEKRTDK